MKSKKENSFLKTLIKYFLQGLFYMVPIAVTIYVIAASVIYLDEIIDVGIPGLGILIIFVTVSLIGYLGSHYLINFFSPFEQLIERTPLIKLIYTSLKDLMNAFVGKKKQFNKPVLVKMGDGFDAERIGFVTKDDLSDLGMGNDKVAVYFPFSYAISGQVYIISKKNISPVDASPADIMKLIVSGGITSIEKHK